MPPDQGQPGPSSHAKREGHAHRERIGNYVIGGEVGHGSFATVYQGYRSKTRVPVAIKAVSRQKLTSKLLENLETEINILKAINHRNVVSLQDCFKNESYIYLIMDFCTGSDLSVYIRKRGVHDTLDFIPRPGGPGAKPLVRGIPTEGEKVYWPHPATGGLDERVTRCFVGQLALALKFLRTQNLIHRDIKPQNLLLQPATAEEIAEGHPYGIPVLKVADFGFARFLPATALADTLCGSPLYMAPEILRFEKYDAKADLWSVGAVLYEMAVGRPPFRAANHVELLRKIEKGDDKIKFPDESRSSSSGQTPPPIPVSADIKDLIRRLLKRLPANRMGFEEFFASGVWDHFMTESIEEGSLSLDVSTDEDSISNLQELDQEVKRKQEPVIVRHPSTDKTHISTSRYSPTPSHPPPRPLPVRQGSVTRSEPKYYVSDNSPSISPNPTTRSTAGPRPITTAAQRTLSAAKDREPSSIEDAAPVTPTLVNTAVTMGRSRVNEGSPLAATPPITMGTERNENGLASSDSILGNEYVVVDTKSVEVNALADEVDQLSKRPTAITRKSSTRTSVTTRPLSAFRPSSITTTPAMQTHHTAAMVPASYSPPFAFSSTPPFAVPSTVRPPISRPPSIPSSLNIFPPPSSGEYPRFGASPASLQTGAIARALTSTAIRLIGTSANSAATVIAKAAHKRRPSIFRTAGSTETDPAEEELLQVLEDVARKAYVLFDLADSKIVGWSTNPVARSTPPFDQSRRRSSSSSANSEVMALRHQEYIMGEAVVLYLKALSFIAEGVERIKKFWERNERFETSADLNETVQWFRARFNECYDKADWAKARCAEELPFVEKILHDKARESARQAAGLELQRDYAGAENGYETALWCLMALLDDVMYDEGTIKEEDRISVEKLIVPIKHRLDGLRRKMTGPDNTLKA
ncbi:serine/threonine-protein kinase ULK2, partial [Tremellales sp. Uapishka_1]